MFKKLILTILCLLGAGLAGRGIAASESGAAAVSGQQGVCRGVVVDTRGETVVGAYVLVSGTVRGTMTDASGVFTLDNVGPGAVHRVFIQGYTTKEVAWTGGDLRIVLEDNLEYLDEVVVVAFGTQKKVNLTGAVSTVDAKEISARPVNSVVDALQGTVPGMNFSTGSLGGALNSPKSFNIRGTGTIGAGSSVRPLVLIDGIEGDLNTLNPHDVASISVLKDASASSIYGSRAAGGVILVTTKSGADGRATVNYSNSFRFNSPLNMPEMMDSYTWALYMNEASVNSGSGRWFQESHLNKIKNAQSDPKSPKMFANASNRWEVWDVTDILPVGNTDWLKEHFGSSFSQEHNLSVSGGSGKTRYYFSAYMLDRDGALRHGDDNIQRYSVSGKITTALASWAELGYQVRFGRTDYVSPSWIDDQVFYHNVMRYWPIVPTKDPNGHWVPESFISELKDGGKHKEQNDVLAQQVSLRVKPLDGLTVNVELNYRINNSNFHKDWLTTYGYDVDGNPYVTNNANSSVYEYNEKNNYFNPNVWAEYARSSGGHNVTLMAGFQSELLNERDFSAQQNGILSGLPTLNTTSTDPKVGGAYNSWSTAGFFGRLNYDFKGRYLFEANLRYDGSSRFTKEKRWNWFPSFSAGWNIAREPFMEPYSDAVNILKLRASWGKLGNQNTDNWYPFYPTIGYSAKAGGWLVGGQKPNISSEPGLVSSLLTWEKSRTWEVGLDWGLFSDRLTGSFGYFQRKTYDMVGPAPELPDILGTGVPKVNNLDMTSKGWDLQIGWRDYIRDFNYGIVLTLSDNIVVIDKYPNESKNLNNYYPGARLGDIWGFTTVGIAKTDQEMNAHLAKADQSRLGSNWSAGDIMYADINGDGVVDRGQGTAGDPGDLKIIGNSTPRFNFGLNLTAEWRGLDLKVFLQGTLKRDYWPGGEAPFWGASGIGKWQALGLKQHLDYFRADASNPLGQNLDSYYPKANWGGGRNNNTQTRYLQNAAYARLKNLTLGYTLPQSLTRKFFVERLRFFASGENLFTLTKFTETADPELVGIGGWGFGKTYPLSKTFSVGLDITF